MVCGGLGWFAVVWGGLRYFDGAVDILHVYMNFVKFHYSFSAFYRKQFSRRAESKRKIMTRIWHNQNQNPALETKIGITKMMNYHEGQKRGLDRYSCSD